jgi:hypothetical protein
VRLHGCRRPPQQFSILPVRLIILADKADKVFPGLEYIPVEKYPHSGEKIVPAANARPRFLIPCIQQQHHLMHLKRQHIQYRIDFTGMWTLPVTLPRCTIDTDTQDAAGLSMF